MECWTRLSPVSVLRPATRTADRPSRLVLDAAGDVQIAHCRDVKAPATLRLLRISTELTVITELAASYT